MNENQIQEKEEKENKLNVEKLKFMEENSTDYDVQSGGCGFCGGCTNWC